MLAAQGASRNLCQLCRLLQNLLLIEKALISSYPIRPFKTEGFIWSQVSPLSLCKNICSYLRVGTFLAFCQVHDKATDCLPSELESKNISLPDLAVLFCSVSWFQWSTHLKITHFYSMWSEAFWYIDLHDTSCQPVLPWNSGHPSMALATGKQDVHQKIPGMTSECQRPLSFRVTRVLRFVPNLTDFVNSLFSACKEMLKATGLSRDAFWPQLSGLSLWLVRGKFFCVWMSEEHLLISGGVIFLSLANVLACD